MSLGAPRHRFTDLNLLSLSPCVGSFSTEVLSWGFYEPEWWRNYPHTHSFFEVCYAYQGRSAFRVGGRDYEVRGGDVFVARPGETHEIVSSHDDPLGIYFWSYTLIPPAAPHSDPDGAEALLTAFFPAGRPVGNRTEPLERTLELLTEEIARREPGYVQAIEGLVVKLLLDTGRAVVAQTIPVEPPHPLPGRGVSETLVRRIVAYLRDNYSRPLAMRDVAAQVHLSERHTNRLFRDVMGVSIMGHVPYSG